MSRNVKLLTRTAVLLALCIASQFMKNASTYVTGSIVNAILVVATLSCGFAGGAAISIIAPVTSWLITGSPIITAMPLVMVCIMGGNLLLVAAVALVQNKKSKWMLPVSLAIGSCVKAAFMWGTIVQAVLPLLGPGSGLPEKALLVAQTTFSVTQLVCALIGSAVAYTVWVLIGKHLDK
jgi:riboflavin transporter FmnP